MVDLFEPCPAHERIKRRDGSCLCCGGSGFVKVGLTVGQVDRMRGEVERLREAVKRLRHVGSLMSNLCFNLAQQERQAPHDRLAMRELCRQWDEITKQESS